MLIKITDKEIYNMLDLYSLQRYREVHLKYFGSELSIIKSKDSSVFLEGVKTSINVRTLSSTATFYNWRIKERRLKSEIPLDTTDFDYLRSLLEKGIFTTNVVSYIIGVSPTALRKYYKNTKDLQYVKNKVDTRKHAPEPALYEWNNERKSADQWGKDIGILGGNFRWRLRKHGICYLTFLPPDEYKRVPKEEKERLTLQSFKDEKVHPTYAPVKRANNSRNEKSLLEEKIEIPAIVNLIAGLIEDSKENLVLYNNAKKGSYIAYRDDSRRFLMNGGKVLEMYLGSVPNIDVEESLKTLHHYATEGYKEHL